MGEGCDLHAYMVRVPSNLHGLMIIVAFFLWMWKWGVMWCRVRGQKVGNQVHGHVVREPHMLCLVTLLEAPCSGVWNTASFPRRWYKWDMLVARLLPQTAAYMAVCCAPMSYIYCQKGMRCFRYIHCKERYMHCRMLSILHCYGNAQGHEVRVTALYDRLMKVKACMKAMIINRIFIIFKKAVPCLPVIICKTFE